jgi:hypothetical protein
MLCDTLSCRPELEPSPFPPLEQVRYMHTSVYTCVVCVCVCVCVCVGVLCVCVLDIYIMQYSNTGWVYLGLDSTQLLHQHSTSVCVCVCMSVQAGIVMWMS